MIEIVDPGPFATIQDLGRAGFAALGVPRSGAFDRGALTLANRLVGNEPGAAGLEVTLGGLRVVLHDAATIALTGSWCAGLDIGVPVTVPAGTTITLGRPVQGLRSYLAVRGGIAVEPVLGSRSTDTLSGLGPAALRAGDRLPVGRSAVELVAAAGVPRPAHASLPVRLGPRDDWFTPAARDALLGTTWRVGSEADRVGVRLDGPALERARTGELASEAMLPGALQVPGGGRPILAGPDAPVTGGYPVVAVVTDLDAAAQLRPGDEIRFRLD